MIIASLLYVAAELSPQPGPGGYASKFHMDGGQISPGQKDASLPAQEQLVRDAV